MQEPKGFGDFFNHSARADGGADAAVTTTNSNGKWSAEAWAAFLAGLGTLFGGALDGASKVIDSSQNAKAMPTAGVQYMSVPASGNKTLWWLLGGGLLLVMLLVLVLRKK